MCRPPAVDSDGDARTDDDMALLKAHHWNTFIYLGVSVPVAWSELESLRATPWNIFNVLAHLEREGADPWKSYWKTKQTLAAARRKLGAA